MHYRYRQFGLQSSFCLLALLLFQCQQCFVLHQNLMQQYLQQRILCQKQYSKRILLQYLCQQHQQYRQFQYRHLLLFLYLLLLSQHFYLLLQLCYSTIFSHLQINQQLRQSHLHLWRCIYHYWRQLHQSLNHQLCSMLDHLQHQHYQLI